MWSWQATAGDQYDIFEIEAVGLALILRNWLHHLTPGALWLQLIENEAARATLVKESSSALSGECMTAYIHARVAQAGLWSWFDRVAGDDNLVDKLSVGEPEVPWDLVDIEFPPILLDSLRA